MAAVALANPATLEIRAGLAEQTTLPDTSADPEFGEFEAINRDVFETFAVAGKIQMNYETRVVFGQPGPL